MSVKFIFDSELHLGARRVGFAAVPTYERCVSYVDSIVDKLAVLDRTLYNLKISYGDDEEEDEETDTNEDEDEGLCIIDSSETYEAAFMGDPKLLVLYVDPVLKDGTSKESTVAAAKVKENTAENEREKVTIVKGLAVKEKDIAGKETEKSVVQSILDKEKEKDTVVVKDTAVKEMVGAVEVKEVEKSKETKEAPKTAEIIQVQPKFSKGQKVSAYWCSLKTGKVVTTNLYIGVVEDYDYNTKFYTVFFPEDFTRCRVPEQYMFSVAQFKVNQLVRLKRDADEWQVISVFSDLGGGFTYDLSSNFRSTVNGSKVGYVNVSETELQLSKDNECKAYSIGGIVWLKQYAYYSKCFVTGYDTVAKLYNLVQFAEVKSVDEKSETNEKNENSTVPIIELVEEKLLLTRCMKLTAKNFRFTALKIYKKFSRSEDEGAVLTKENFVNYYYSLRSRFSSHVANHILALFYQKSINKLDSTVKDKNAISNLSIEDDEPVLSIEGFISLYSSLSLRDAWMDIFSQGFNASLFHQEYCYKLGEKVFARNVAVDIHTVIQCIVIEVLKEELILSPFTCTTEKMLTFNAKKNFVSPDIRGCQHCFAKRRAQWVEYEDIVCICNGNRYFLPQH